MLKHEMLLAVTAIVAIWLPCAIWMFCSPTWRLRRRFWSVLHSVFGIPALWLVMANGSNKPAGWWMGLDWWVVSILAGAVMLTSALGVRSAWRQARVEEKRFTGDAGVTSLQRQLLWLILPVLFLFGFGIFTLIRDRSQSQRSVYQQAALLAENMVVLLSQELPLELFQFDSWAESFDRSSQERSRRETLRTQYRLAGEPASTHSAPMIGRVDADGQILGLDEVPNTDATASWLATSRVPELRQALGNVFSATNEATSDAAMDWLEQRVAQAPPTQKNLISFRLDMELLAKYNRIRWSEGGELAILGLLLELNSTVQASRIADPTGTSLAILSFLEFRRRFPNTPLQDWTVSMIYDLTFRHPSPMTPWLIEQGISMAQITGDPARKQNMQWLQELWKQQQRFRELTRRLMELQPLTPTTTASRWFSQGERYYFATIKPGRSISTTWHSGRSETRTSLFAEVRIYDEDTLGMAAGLVLRQYTKTAGGPIQQLPSLPAGWRRRSGSTTVD